MSSATVSQLSASMQMYLKSVYEIQRKKGAARVTDIANRVGVNKASVTSALRNLAKRKLLHYAPYDVITLTDEGTRVAEGIERKYEALKTFFTDVLGVDEELADKEACDLEHHLSPAIHERLVGFIEYYESCATTRFRWSEDAGGFCVDPD
jgi:DtxR family Mn-dependent transcriptional regulator